MKKIAAARILFPLLLFYLTACKTGLTDTRNNRAYKIAKINGLWWMTENVNYPIAGSVPY